MRTQKNAQAELPESLGRSSRIGIARTWVVAGLALAATMTAWAESGSAHSPWVHRATKVAPADENQQVTIALHLKLHNETTLVQLIKQLYDPASNQYGHFLTSAQFRAQFAPTAGDVQAVADVLAQHGLTAVPTESPLYVKFMGTVGQVNEAFQVSQNYYSYKSKTLRSQDTSPVLPDKLADLVVYANIDDTRTLVHPLYRRAGEDPNAPPPAPTAPLAFCSTYWSDHVASVSPAPTPYGASGTVPWAICGYTPQQLRAAYGVDKTTRDGSGVRVGVVDAFASPTIFSDINTYASRHGLPPFTSANFSQIIPAGIYNVPATDPCGPQGWYMEESLDIESVHSMAPGATIVYIGGADCSQGLPDAFYAAINNQVADILTNSYGYDSEDVGAALILADLAAHEQAAAEGITVLFSSGDLGDNIPAGNQIAQGSWPATSPLVTAVGGTSLALSANGTKQEWGWGNVRAALTSPAIAPDGSSVTGTGWGAFSYYASSGGGTSLLFFQPDYQKGTVPNALASQTALDSGLLVTLLPERRVIPDISMVGDPITGFLFGMTYTTSATANANVGCTPIDATTEYCEGGIGGTSLSSPLFAGVIALVDQQRKAHGRGPVGFVTPALYRVPRGSAGTFTHAVNDIDAPSSPTAALVHRLGGLVRVYTINSEPDATGTAVIEGAETSLLTTPGYDNVTGLGVPYAPAFLNALGGHDD
jgi:subtilase family serine protease